MSNSISNRKNIPACPAGVCLRILSEYIGRRPSLKSFYDEDSLVECALRAEAMINDLTMSGCDLQTAKELSIFVLFDLVVLIEDNQSMLNAENDGALKALRNRLWEIARIYDVANPGIGIKSIRFLNQENGRRNVTSRTMGGLLGDYRFRANADRAAIGAMLDKRILQRFIYNPPFRLKKPVIIMIIIHSEVEDESQHSLEEAINDCVLRCKASNSLGEGAATFHLSRVGLDKGAERYLTRLMARGVQNLYCFPPLADLPPESPGEIPVISETTRILFRDALDLHLMDIPIDENAGPRDEIDPYSDLSDWSSADEDILPASPPTWFKKHPLPPPRSAVWHTNVNLVFRVRGIPHGATLTDISDALSSIPKFELTGITIDPYESTIVPDCYSAKTQVALIQFTAAVPPALTTLQTNETFTARLATGEEITVDKDFFGYTQLYSPIGEIAADIVAVCGLNGHPYGSWAAKPDFYGNKRMWLRHFLPKKFPQCRTMIYGYNSNLKDQSRHGIHDYVDTFLEEMEKIRNTEKEKARPVILIGHSFGGIVIAHSVVKAYRKHSSSIITNIRGIIFFGTPHRGLLVDDLLTMVGDASPRVEMIQELSPGSQVLQETLETFISICEQRRWKIVSFRERGQTRKLVKGGDGVWARKGEYYTAVESESLVLNLPSTIEETLPAEGDHSTMVKFEHEYHSTYTSLLRALHGPILKKASTHRRRREAASPSVFESEGKRARRQRRQSSV